MADKETKNKKRPAAKDAKPPKAKKQKKEKTDKPKKDKVAPTSLCTVWSLRDNDHETYPSSYVVIHEDAKLGEKFIRMIDGIEDLSIRRLAVELFVSLAERKLAYGLSSFTEFVSGGHTSLTSRNALAEALKPLDAVDNRSELIGRWKNWTGEAVSTSSTTIKTPAGGAVKLIIKHLYE